MDKDVQDIILYELRELRKEVTKIDTTVTTLKVKFGVMAAIFGVVGGSIKPMLVWLSHK